MHTTLAQAFPHIAAQIDAERVLLARPIAEHTTCEWSDKEIILHCDDDATYQLLTIPSQATYLREAFPLPIHAMRKLPASESPPLQVSPSPNLASKRTANTLTFTERAALQNWMHQPENAHFVAHESDTDAARQASKALDPVHITAANIASMRKILGIEKVKPEKPAPLQLPDGLTLADLQVRVNAHEERLDALRVEGQGINAALLDLQRCLSDVVAKINNNVTPLDPVRGPSWTPTPSPSSQSGQ